MLQRDILGAAQAAPASPDRTFDQGEAKRLHAMASFGMPRSVVGVMIEAFFPGKLKADDRRYLMGPLVVHDGGWMDTLPAWLPKAVDAERVGIVLGATPEYIVGPAEITAVMYGATMVAPLRHDCADLYMWASANAAARHKGIEVAALFDDPDSLHIPGDKDVLWRGGRLFETYRGLAHEIRRKVISHQEGRERAERREAKQTTPAAEATPRRANDVVATQMQMFA